MHLESFAVEQHKISEMNDWSFRNCQDPVSASSKEEKYSMKQFDMILQQTMVARHFSLIFIDEKDKT